MRSNFANRTWGLRAMVSEILAENWNIFAFFVPFGWGFEFFAISLLLSRPEYARHSTQREILHRNDPGFVGIGPSGDEKIEIFVAAC